MTTGNLDSVRRLVYEQASLVLDESKDDLILSRLRPLLPDHGFKHVSELIDALADPRRRDLRVAVVESMLTHETSFFRDLRPYEALRDHILPAMIEQRRVARTLNIWSAACSSGQEPYTVAMVIREHFPELMGWNLRILATDFSSSILERAREGRYTRFESRRGLTANFLEKYFVQSGNEVVVRDEIRRMVEFNRLNLAAPWGAMPVLDLVLLRNVMIYFDNTTRTGILERAHRQLRPGGLLALGASESLVFMDVPFTRELHAGTVWYRRN